MMNALRRIQFFLILILTGLSSTQCQLINLVECGSFHECRDDRNLHSFLTLALLARMQEGGVTGANLAAVSKSGASDDPAIYNSSPYVLSQDEWNENAVRKVLQTFAFGGGATSAQIKTWADMSPGHAIVEMIGMWTTHSKLAVPYQGGGSPVGESEASLSRLANYFANGNLSHSPSEFDTTQRWGNAPGNAWVNAVKLRGLNPFRQKIGLFETNYHLAVNLNKNVSPEQMVVYYDTIANDIAEGLPYHEVLANAAVSAAVATQYNHRRNIFERGAFQGNEDFAREYHQLFFGILGTGLSGNCNLTPDSECAGNPETFNQHESRTIRQTAEALTDIQVEGSNNNLPVFPKFGTTLHAPGMLTIYGKERGGSNAKERIQAISPDSINHQESKAFLPLIIVRGLADGNLDPDNPVDGCLTSGGITGITGCNATAIQQKVDMIRNLWNQSTQSSSGQINLIEFIRRYAVSSAFHNPTRIHFLNSAERTMILSNQLGINNEEVGRNLIPSFNKLRSENVTLFRPEHDVFGGQTGLEAANTDDVFINQYNSARNSRFGAIGYWNGRAAVPLKNYRYMLEKELNKSSDFRVQDVAEFFWRKITADHNLKYFTPSARVQVYSLLANGNDFLFYKDTDCRNQEWNCKNESLNQPTTTVPSTDLNLDNPSDEVRNLKESVLFRSGADESDLERDNESIGYAVDFIAATPYSFVQTHD